MAAHKDILTKESLIHSINQLITKVFVKQPLAKPGSAKYLVNSVDSVTLTPSPLVNVRILKYVRILVIENTMYTVLQAP